MILPQSFSDTPNRAVWVQALAGSLRYVLGQGTLLFFTQALVVQRADSSIQWINCYPWDKCWRNKLHYPLDSDLSDGKRYPLADNQTVLWVKLRYKVYQSYL